MLKVYHLRHLNDDPPAWAIVVAHNSTEARHLAGWRRSETKTRCIGEYTGARQDAWVMAQRREGVAG